MLTQDSPGMTQFFDFAGFGQAHDAPECEVTVVTGTTGPIVACAGCFVAVPLENIKAGLPYPSKREIK